MKKGFVLLAVILMMGFTHISFAQDESEVNIGIGIEAINTYNSTMFLISSYNFSFDTYSNGFPKVYFPINLNNQFKVEPIIGFQKTSIEVGKDKESSRIFHLGVGVFKTIPYNSFQAYIGGRFAMSFLSQSYNNHYFDGYDYYSDKDERNRKDWELAPAIGGEYYFNEHFSFGGECSFNYTSYGKWEYDDNVSDDDYSNTQMNLKPLVFVRWYF